MKYYPAIDSTPPLVGHSTFFISFAFYFGEFYKNLWMAPPPLSRSRADCFVSATPGRKQMRARITVGDPKWRPSGSFWRDSFCNKPLSFSTLLACKKEVILFCFSFLQCKCSVKISQCVGAIFFTNNAMNPFSPKQKNRIQQCST